jgi:hypothetical protein
MALAAAQVERRQVAIGQIHHMDEIPLAAAIRRGPPG